VADIVAGDANFTTFRRANGTSGARSDELRLFVPGTNNTKLALSYTSYGSLHIGGNPSQIYPDTRPYYFVIGTRSPVIPASGKATYSGIVDGISSGGVTRISGTSTLIADLLSDTVKLNLDLKFTTNPVVTSSGLPPLALSGQGFFDRAQDGFIYGSLASSTGAIQSGIFNGGFYGPNREEFGITFSTRSAGASFATAPNPPSPPYYNLDGISVGTLTSLASNPVTSTLDNSLQAGEVLVAIANTLVLGSGYSGNYGADPSTISYDSTSGKYTIARERGYSGNFSFGPSDQVSGSSSFTTYKVHDDYDPDLTTKNVTVGLFKTGANNPQIALTYASYGFYNFPTLRSQPDSIDNYAFFPFGNPTPVGSIPTSGSATYNGIVDGIYGDTTGIYRMSGTSTLSASFAGQSLTTSMTFTGTNLASGGAPLVSQTYTGSASFVQPVPNINGQFGGHLSSSQNPGVSGQFIGSFYGPAAEEFAYSFRLFNGTTSANATTFGVGVALGKK
jgi:hypothetical protein